MENYKKIITNTILADEGFVRAIFSGGKRKNNDLLQKVIIRPVSIKGVKHMQFSYLDNKKDITKNYTEDMIPGKLHHVIKQKFAHITLETSDQTIRIEIPAKGKISVSTHTNKTEISVSLAHDREKSTILSPDTVYPFLQAIEIQTKEGKIKADKYNKFRQINEFLKIIAETVDSEHLKNPVHIIDFGCGNGYLTFAIYYYFNEVLHIPTYVTGIDRQGNLLKSLREKAKHLMWEKMEFIENSIADAPLPSYADIVIALHACDTATDDALARAVALESSYIFSSPCCHNHLQKQLQSNTVAALFQPVFHNGILGERLGDILTDTFRSLILQILGYKTDVMEFVSTEHTGKNLLIRAVKSNDAHKKRSIHEYKTLKKYWNVSPYLEKQLSKTHNVSFRA